MRSEPRKINVDLSSSFKQQLVIINQLCNWVVLNYLLPCSVSQLLTSVSFVSPAGAEPPQEQGQAASLVSEGDGVRFSYQEQWSEETRSMGPSKQLQDRTVNKCRNKCSSGGCVFSTEHEEKECHGNEWWQVTPMTSLQCLEGCPHSLPDVRIQVPWMLSEES